MKFFLDTFVLVEIAKGSIKLAKYLETDNVTLDLNLAEFCYVLLREGAEAEARRFLPHFERISQMDFRDALVEAASFKFRHKKANFSYADCLGYVFARKNDRVFVTGDRQFRGMENVELVE